MKRALALALVASLCGCFDFQKAIDGCKDGGVWVCPRPEVDGGGGGGGNGGGGGGGGPGGAGGGTVIVLGDGGCPGAEHKHFTAQGPWCWHNPLPTGIDLTDVVGTADDDVTVVGGVDTVLHWDGTAWTQDVFPSVDSTRNVTSAAIDETGTLYIAGYGIGGLWSKPLGGMFGLQNPNIDGVTQLAPRPGGGVLAATESGVFAQDSVSPVFDNVRRHLGVVATGPGQLDFLTSVAGPGLGSDGGDARCVYFGDSGVDFCEARVFGGPAPAFNRLWLDAQGRATAAAEGTLYNSSNEVGSVHRRLGPGNWVQLVNGTSGVSDLYGGTALEGGASFAVGQGCTAAVVYADGGGTVAVIPACSDSNFKSAFWARDAGMAWAVGERGNIVRGDPFAPSDSARWSQVTRGPRDNFYAMAEWNGGLWAAGSNDKLFSVLDHRSAITTASSVLWRGAWAAANGSLILAGEDGRVARVNADGGYSSVTPQFDGGSLIFYDVWGTSDDEVFLTSSKGLFSWSVDAGTQVRQLVNNRFFTKVHGDPVSGRVFAVGDNAAIWSRASFDAGWVEDNTNGSALYGVRYVSDTEAWAVGSFLAFRWDGAIWQPVDSPNAALFDVVSGTNGVYVVGELGTALRLSRDGNDRWLSLRSPTPTGFERVHLVGGRLFIAGDQGNVLSMPEP